MPKTFGILAAVGLPMIMAWMTWSAWLSGPVISDSWQSLGPMVFAHRPFDLSGAFLGDFDGFNRTWGHHWPGWALFMSLFRPWFVFNPLGVFVIEVLLVMLSSLMVFRVGLPVVNWWWSVALASLTLLGPDINVSLSMMRPEPLSGLLMMLLAWMVIEGLGTRREIVIIVLSSAALPLVHVLGVVTPPALIGCLALWHRFSLREIWKDPRRNQFIALGGGWIIGIVSLGIWFLGDVERLHQFKENLAAQRLSAHGVWNSFRSSYLSDVGGGMMLLLWMAVGLAMVVSVQKSSRNLRCLLWAAMPVAAVVFSILAHNPNRLHLAAVVPCALTACKLGAFMQPVHSVRRLGRILLPVMAFALAFHLNRGVRIWQTGGRSSRTELVELIKRHQGIGRLYIPLSLWEAAATLPAPEALFYTFPNVATPEYREAAERTLFAKALPGDRLIFDVTQNQASNDYFKRETFVHLTHVDVNSLGPVVETCTVKGMTGSHLYHVIKIERLPFSK